MNKFFKTLAAATLISAVGISSAMAVVAAGPHDMRKTKISEKTNATTQICVFCHTPHSSNTTATNIPLWNRADGSETFQPYASSTLATPAGYTPAGASLACLSCHDGATAIDSIVNAPTSGDWGTADAFTLSTITLSNANANLGLDLRNEHPISMTVPTGSDWVLAATIEASALELYGASDDTVQCGSCHDPHSANDNFVRISNAGSALCLTCHTK